MIGNMFAVNWSLKCRLGNCHVKCILLTIIMNVDHFADCKVEQKQKNYLILTYGFHNTNSMVI